MGVSGGRLDERFGAVPGQQLVEPRSRMIGDAAQRIGEPSLGIEAIEFGRGNQGIDRGGALAAAV